MSFNEKEQSGNGIGGGYRIAAGWMAALFALFTAIPAMAEEKLPPTTFTLNVPVKLSRVTDDVKIYILYSVSTGMGYQARGSQEVPLKDGSYDGTVTITGKIEYNAMMANPMMMPGTTAVTPAPTPQTYPGSYTCELEIRYANGQTYRPDPNAALDGYRAAKGTPISSYVEGAYAW